MKRFVVAALAGMLFSPLMWISGSTVMVQTPEPPVPATSLDELILRIAQGNGYVILVGGQETTFEGEAMLLEDGTPIAGVSEAEAASYAANAVRSVYNYQITMVSEETSRTTTIDMRLLTFAGTVEASGFVAVSFEDELQVSAQDPEAPQDLAAIENLPEHDGAVAGWTATELFRDSQTGEVGGAKPSARFLAQQEATVTSVKVASADPAANDAIARELLAAQLACLESGAPCKPIPLPVTESPVAESSTTVIIERANVRSEPSDTATVVAVVTEGQVVTVTGEPVTAGGFDWLPITTPDGIEGWIVASLVEH